MSGIDGAIGRGKDKSSRPNSLSLSYCPKSVRFYANRVCFCLLSVTGELFSSLPTDLLVAELRRRQQDGHDRPACGSVGRGEYDVTAHVFALLLILTLSTFGKCKFCTLVCQCARSCRGRLTGVRGFGHHSLRLPSAVQTIDRGAAPKGRHILLPACRNGRSLGHCLRSPPPDCI